MNPSLQTMGSFQAYLTPGATMTPRPTTNTLPTTRCRTCAAPHGIGRRTTPSGSLKASAAQLSLPSSTRAASTFSRSSSSSSSFPSPSLLSSVLKGGVTACRVRLSGGRNRTLTRAQQGGLPGGEDGRVETADERFLQEVAAMGQAVQDNKTLQDLQADLQGLNTKVDELQKSIDSLYSVTFSELEVEQEEGGETVSFADMDEAKFSDLGRNDPTVLKALIQVASADKTRWTAFQSEAQTLTLQRTRLRSKAEGLKRSIKEEEANVIQQEAAAQREKKEAEEDEDEERVPMLGEERQEGKIVLVSGFESFNVKLYRDVADDLRRLFPGLRMYVFSDRDLDSKRGEVEAALDGADVFFGSLLFDYDQVEWLRQKIENIPVRLVFESGLELMGKTQVGTFQMNPDGKSKGPPAPVKAVLSKFGSGKEEDKMAGYLSFLKIGPKLLKWLPGKKVRDLRNWLTIYSYWNEGGQANVKQAFLHLTNEYLFKTELKAAPIVETPPTGVYHPAFKGYHTVPEKYITWYRTQYKKSLPVDTPVVAILLYRKHVITNAKFYINQIIEEFEDSGFLPLPIFINGVEAHTVVRDQLTTAHEQSQRAQGVTEIPSLKPNAVSVDAIVSTIGFPLVGGPAGTMEGGRQSEVAKAILQAKNVPYTVAAPLLIQDMEGWDRNGVGGLQSVVLYSLPELDGAVDTVPLGGLVGENILLAGERVKALTNRLNRWIKLRRTPPSERKVAMLMYGFPPGVGATGTAALLNVPRSLEAILGRLREEGYDVGLKEGEPIPSGEELVSMLSRLDDERAVNLGAAGLDKEFSRVKQHLATQQQQREEQGEQGEPARQLSAAQPGNVAVAPQQLKEWLTFPDSWGPTEWGPIPYLPDNTILVDRMERQWGPLRSYRGIKSAADGQLVVPGIQLGNVWIGVQPVLGVEGDPMRLLFERDLTPHPQYAAFYKWLQHPESSGGYGADAVVHVGMHGTVEWLPGQPLGNTALSWSDALMGDLPNLYVYAANNPSESIVAKRRGYGTIVSYNVPPYGRAGLYKQLAALKELVGEYRESEAGGGEGVELRRPILDALTTSGLMEDCPFRQDGEAEGEDLTEDNVDDIPQAEFDEYVSRLNTYLQVVEGRLFSEGLHVLGQPPLPGEMEQYLSAYFDDQLPSEVVSTISNSPQAGYSQVHRSFQHHHQDSLEGGGAGDWEWEEDKVREAISIRDLLMKNTEELDSLVKGLNGEYLLPEAGGDLLRDGPGVLPTGRNIHALDPYRMPSPAAMDRGAQIAEAILENHKKANNGAYPETVSVALWGLDAIKTKGESVGILLSLVGARPVKEGTGRIVRFELVPLEELKRPRIDVLANMSGIFRDSFANVVELLDAMFEQAGEAPGESVNLNFIKKHAQAMAEQGVEAGTARLFSNPAGDYGSMVNERVGAGNWEEGQELGDTWAARNSFSYGRGGEKGTARPEVLQQLLATTQHVVQEVDSVEYGLTDIQEYYANTGALQNAASNAQGGRKVQCSIVETFGKAPAPRDLDATLRLEYRSKLLNPKWAEAMASQGSGGAYEISQRMTALVGWGATSDFTEDWVYDGSYETYVQDEEMREKLRKANPQAFSNVVRRMLEAAGRGLWNADDKTLENLKEIYAEMDEVLEGVTIN